MERSKLGMLDRTWKKGQSLLLFPVSLWVYVGTVTEKDTNLISIATVSLQIGTSDSLVRGKN